MKLPRQRPVDVRTDQGVERMRDLGIFALADHGAFLGKKAFADNVAEQFRVGPVGETQHIVEALRRGSVLIRVLRPLLGIAEHGPEIRVAARNGVRHVLTELQRNERADFVGCVLLAVIATCQLSWLVLLAAAVLVRRTLDRRRLSAWEAEWRASGPLWSGHRG